MENWKKERMEADIREVTEKIRKEAEERSHVSKQIETEENKLEKDTDNLLEDTKTKENSFSQRIYDWIRKFFIFFVSVIILSSCTENVRSRKFGGTQTIDLKPNEIVLNVTWKQDDMWICTKDTSTGVVYFREKSNWGVLDGTVVFK